MLERFQKPEVSASSLESTPEKVSLIVGNVVLQYETGSISPGEYKKISKEHQELPLKKLQSLKVESSTGQEIDLLQVINPEGLPIYLNYKPFEADLRGTGYFYDNPEKKELYVISIPPITPAAVGALFHEFGHVEQRRDSATAELYKLYHKNIYSYNLDDEKDRSACIKAVNRIATIYPILENRYRVSKLLEELEMSDRLFQKEREQEQAIRKVQEEFQECFNDLLGQVHAQLRLHRDVLCAPSENAGTEAFFNRFGIHFDRHPPERFKLDLFRDWISNEAPDGHEAVLNRETLSSQPRIEISHMLIDIFSIDTSAEVYALSDVHHLASRALTLKQQLADYKKNLPKVHKEAVNARISINDRLKAVLEIPRKVMERDATRRSLVWLRELRRKYRIDILRSEPVPLEGVLKALNHCLTTYEAHSQKLRVQYGRVPQRVELLNHKENDYLGER